MNKNQLKTIINADSTKIEYGISKLESALDAFEKSKRMDEHIKKYFFKYGEHYAFVVKGAYQ